MRKKHAPRLSENVIKYCLEEAGVFTREFDYVVFCDKPFLSFKRFLMSYLKPINKKAKEGMRVTCLSLNITKPLLLPCFATLFIVMLRRLDVHIWMSSRDRIS